MIYNTRLFDGIVTQCKKTFGTMVVHPWLFFVAVGPVRMADHGGARPSGAPAAVARPNRAAMVVAVGPRSVCDTRERME